MGCSCGGGCVKRKRRDRGMRNSDNPHFRGEVVVTFKDDFVPFIYDNRIFVKNYVVVVVATLSK